MLASFLLPCLGLIFLLPIGLAALWRPKEGFWLAWGLGICILPAWLSWQFSASVGINARTAIALGGCVVAMLFPRPALASRWCLVDLLAFGCVAAMLVSQVMTGSAGPFVLISLSSIWLTPYLVGRWFFTSVDDIGRFARLMVPILILTILIGLIEMTTKVNIYHYLFGRTLEYQARNGELYRMGMKRVTIGVDLPISFGMLMALVMPWSIVAARRPGWRRLLPALNVAASALSLSRGPVVMCLLGWAIAVFFQRPRLRRLLGTVGVLGACFFFFALEPILDASASAIGDVASSTIVVNGRVEAVNSTRQRKLMREVYAPVLVDAGLYGFGSASRLAELPGIYKIPRVLASVESHYYHHQLLYGKVGVYGFDLFAAGVVLTFAWLAWRPRGPIEDLAALLTGTQCGILLGVLSVFFPDEFRAVWLFNAGLAGNLIDLRRKQSADLRRAAAAAAPARAS